MEVKIPLTTSFGPGQIVFAVDEVETQEGRLLDVEIPDPVVKEKWNALSGSNPLGFPISGGAIVPPTGRTHLEVIDQILQHIFLEQIPGFDYELHEPIAGAAQGDVVR